MKWFSSGVNFSRSCLWLFQLAAQIHKAAFRGLCFNNVLLYQLIMPLWPMKEECYTLPPQCYLFFCQKGAAELWKVDLTVVSCSFENFKAFITIKRGACLCVGLLWITLKPVSDIYVVFLMVRLFLGSCSLRGSLLAFLSSAFYPSRNDCNVALAQDPCQRLQGWSVWNSRVLSYALWSTYGVLLRPQGLELGDKWGVKCFHLVDNSSLKGELLISSQTPV